MLPIALGIHNNSCHLIKIPFKLWMLAEYLKRAQSHHFEVHFDPKCVNLGCLHFFMCCHVIYTPHKIRNIDLGRKRGEKRRKTKPQLATQSRMQALSKWFLTPFYRRSVMLYHLEFVSYSGGNPLELVSCSAKAYMCCSGCCCDKKWKRYSVGDIQLRWGEVGPRHIQAWVINGSDGFSGHFPSF